MKKITNSDLKGLAELFPVYNEDGMRKIIGGSSVDEIAGYLGNALGGQGTTTTDSNGNTTWHRNDGSSSYPYSQDQFDNWSGAWTGGFVYGWGYVSPAAMVYGSANSVTYGFGYVMEKRVLSHTEALNFFNDMQGGIGTIGTVAGIGTISTVAGALIGIYSWLASSQWKSFASEYVNSGRTNGVIITETRWTSASGPVPPTYNMVIR